MQIYINIVSTVMFFLNYMLRIVIFLMRKILHFGRKMGAKRELEPDTKKCQFCSQHVNPMQKISSATSVT